MYLASINKKLLCFYYHLNCRHINDNAGDIKLDVLPISQNTFYAYLHIKSDQNDDNGKDFKCIWLKSIKGSYVFFITSIVVILMTIKVILNLMKCQ